MQAGGYISSGVSVARSATEGRGLEGFADGDGGVGAEGAEGEHVERASLVVRPIEGLPV